MSKSIVTAHGKMDLERKASRAIMVDVRPLLAFSNGNLQSLYNSSNGFYRRQLILTTKEKPADRVDDPDIAEKMKLEIEGIFLWAFEAYSGWRQTTSVSRKVSGAEQPGVCQARREQRHRLMESTGYIRLKADMSVTSKECMPFMESGVMRMG